VTKFRLLAYLYAGVPQLLPSVIERLAGDSDCRVKLLLGDIGLMALAADFNLLRQQSAEQHRGGDGSAGPYPTARWHHDHLRWNGRFGLGSRKDAVGKSGGLRHGAKLLSQMLFELIFKPAFKLVFKRFHGRTPSK
jgi:hypothetical protein